jgi:IS605 OrfB family transposase
MRKVKKHGKNHVFNQIILENGVYSQFKGKDGNTWLKIPSLIRNQRISVPLNSKVTLSGMLRIILRNNIVEVHYLANNKQHKICGTGIVGIDKGYTEVFTDSDGEIHGSGFNLLLNNASEQRMQKNKVRNKLYQIAKKSSKSKYERIMRNNLGIKKRFKQNSKIKQQIRGHCFKAAHAVADKAKIIIAEDLTASIKKKSNWKKYNRLMSSWMKKSITEALETVSKVRGSDLHYVNAAYTSQMDSKTGQLLGVRVGDKFHHVNGDVSHADINAACNIKQRLYDKDITRYMPYQKVKQILLNRLHATEELPILEVKNHPLRRPSLQDSSYKPEMDINRERINLRSIVCDF